ncbi:PREDICTED: RILP-like protein homolog isoform X2 [Nicrophorus vespilloides]|uniref:RILP-like protein homolog isoform X2 n=1 Tax=Nicrophorus vespilloides TaxID=110193 RepID=A0ABM1NK20_NICVS|nr:PREDICTED: RILP-like protein homolog isoform X2 [Nicrophorus vespilloides]
MPKHRFVRPRSRTMMNDLEDVTGDVTVVDVYDIASEIGKECEKIIDQYGAEAVTVLLPKVINALELLESLAQRNERENTQLYELQAKISQLENDKIEKAEYRQKFDQELEAIEDQWRSESKELVALVSRLQGENRRLVKEHENSQHYEPRSPTEVICDGAMLQRLKATLEKQRDEIRTKDKAIQDKSCDIDTLRSQVDRLTGISRELRRKHKVLQNQVRNLCDERADFLVQLQDQHRDVTALRQRLGLAEKENEDLSKCDTPVPSNKAVYDLDDPNRPRFTTAELKDILNERNELKARVSDLEDELDTYRPKEKVETPSSQSDAFIETHEDACSVVFNTMASSLIASTIFSEPLNEDAPVQGPLPYEPDDAPWKKSSESGIRKLAWVRSILRSLR